MLCTPAYMVKPGSPCFSWAYIMLHCILLLQSIVNTLHVLDKQTRMQCNTKQGYDPILILHVLTIGKCMHGRH